MVRSPDRGTKRVAAPRSTGGRRTAGVQSAEVGLSLLSLLAHQRRPIKITALAALAGMAPAKAHRYLASLVRAGFAAQDPDTGLYSTGPAALDFSLSCLSTIEPIETATQEAAALCRAIDHTVALSVWGTFGPTVVRWEQPARPVMVNIGPGSVFPLMTSATGRVFAAFHEPAIIAAHRAADEQRAATRPQPLPGAVGRAVDETVDDVRRRGLARAQGDFMSGLSAFAAPVFDHRDRLVLVMTALDYTVSWDDRWDGAIAPQVRAAAERASAALGYRRAASPSD